jgi:hypothetical protein
MLLYYNTPNYRSRRKSAECARADLIFAAYEHLWRNRCVACRSVGTDFVNEDYMIARTSPTAAALTWPDSPQHTSGNSLRH